MVMVMTEGVPTAIIFDTYGERSGAMGRGNSCRGGGIDSDGDMCRGVVGVAGRDAEEVLVCHGAKLRVEEPTSKYYLELPK